MMGGHVRISDHELKPCLDALMDELLGDQEKAKSWILRLIGDRPIPAEWKEWLRPRATGCPDTMDDTARFAADELPAILREQAS